MSAKIGVQTILDKAFKIEVFDCTDAVKMPKIEDVMLQVGELIVA